MRGIEVIKTVEINSSNFIDFIIQFETGKLTLYQSLCLMHYIWKGGGSKRYYRHYIHKLNHFNVIGLSGVNIENYFRYLSSEMSAIEHRTGRSFDLSETSQLAKIFNHIINKQTNK